jgi:hypothetical protein
MDEQRKSIASRADAEIDSLAKNFKLLLATIHVRCFIGQRALFLRSKPALLSLCALSALSVCFVAQIGQSELKEGSDSDDSAVEVDDGAKKQSVDIAKHSFPDAFRDAKLAALQSNVASQNLVHAAFLCFLHLFFAWQNLLALRFLWRDTPIQRIQLFCFPPRPAPPRPISFSIFWRR